MSTLFTLLEKEFCPPLDTSLLAVLLAELESDNDVKSLSPSSPQVERLCNTLRELALHADEVQLSEFSEIQLTSATEDTDSSHDFGNSRTTGCTSLSSGSSSGSCAHSFSSSLGFLRAALPDVPLHTLKKTLKDAEQNDSNLDMWDIIANTLSAESIRELEERGLDLLDEADANLREEDIEWEIVVPKSKKAKHPVPQQKNKRKIVQGTKVALVDIRQQHHVKPQRKDSANGHDKAQLPDLWTQISSISTLMASYLSPHPPAIFQSFFHSPQYDTPYRALCAALDSICDTDERSEEFLPVVFNILDILLAKYDDLNAEERSRLIHDVELCVRATKGRGDDAIDIAKVLRDLDSDATSGKWELGVYHLPTPSKSSTSPSTFMLEHSRPDPTVPYAIPKMPSKPPPSIASARKPKPNPLEWQTIPVRKPQNNGPYPLSLNIPAYGPVAANGYKVKGSGNGHGMGGKGDVGELISHQRIAEHQRRRKEYLEQAAKMWQKQKGDKKSHSGEIAYYYAEKAREFQQLAKREALENARSMVLQKRFTTGNYDTIDLHGTTVSEALVIVNEVLQDSHCSPSQPLKIITGRGSHSLNKIGVLKPAVKNALVKDGWDVGTWDAGLVIRGKRHKVVG